MTYEIEWVQLEDGVHELPGSVIEHFRQELASIRERTTTEDEARHQLWRQVHAAIDNWSLGEAVVKTAAAPPGGRILSIADEVDETRGAYFYLPPGHTAEHVEHTIRMARQGAAATVDRPYPGAAR